MTPQAMTPLAIIRHGSTEWNEDGRIQGTTDIPLSTEGRAAVSACSAPPEFADYRWVSSPLKRAMETARLLAREPEIEPLLSEMNHGRWEGRRLADLRAELGEEMAENERRGLDFQPPGGESPRQVQHRLRPWLAEVGGSGIPTVAVSHNGVLRAVYALACGWDMTGKPPVKLIRAAIHLFSVGADGVPRIDRLNIPLVEA